MKEKEVKEQNRFGPINSGEKQESNRQGIGNTSKKHGVELSNRLLMVVSMVTKGNRIADIGCDHAHTSIYLAEQGISEKILALDINEGPLLCAKENIRLYGCESYITTRWSDGAKALQPGEADTLLLSGMGGGLMCRILSESPDVVKAAKELVLQPQSELGQVRHFLHDGGFRISKENMLTEDGKHYTAIQAVHGTESYDKPVFYHYGKLLLEQKNASLFAFLNYGKKRFEEIEKVLSAKVGKVPSGQAFLQERTAARLREIQKNLCLIREALTYYEKEQERGRPMNMIKVVINGREREYAEGTTYLEISKDVEKEYNNTIILAKLGGNLKELDKKLETGGNLTFITTGTETGRKTYSRGIIMVLMKAIYHEIGKENIRKASIEFSHGPGYYGEIDMDQELTGELLEKIEDYMRVLIKKDLPFEKFTIDTRDAIKKFHEYRMFAKEKLFRYRRVSKTNIYNLDGFEDYFYGYMPYSTGCLKYFKLIQYEDGFILQIPKKENSFYVPKFEPKEKLFRLLKEVTCWNRSLEIDTVGALNDVIASGGMGDLILVQEALQEKKIAEIAEEIAKRPDRKFVMIAGPSSSGKTTFSHRLSIQLRTYGLKPHPIGLDDYFKNREDTPLNEDGTYNFECLEAIDVEQFNKDMVQLLQGKRVELPTFNFKAGKREYRGNYMSMGPEDILVIEGIHGLNDKLSYSLPEESKFKIYISALTALNIDEHNQISTSDGRLIRRMVRDARSRGTKASETIEMWKSVRAGEERYIFPYQESADVMFNSAMNYELSVLKPFAEPILFGIGEEEPAYMEAKRMLKFLDYFVGVSSEDVPKNSILREFIGNSYFNV